MSGDIDKGDSHASNCNYRRRIFADRTCHYRHRIRADQASQGRQELLGRGL
jgi:hypothetical protein